MSFSLFSNECFACFDHHRDDEIGQSHLFFDLHADHYCQTATEVAQTLDQIPTWQSQGYYVVLMASYELGAYFLPKLPLLAVTDQTFPLLHCLVFKQQKLFSYTEMNEWFTAYQTPPVMLGPLSFELTQQEYRIALEEVLKHLGQGDTYQLNYTFRGHIPFQGDPLALYAQLRQHQYVSYGAFIQHPRHTILSLSPELFVKKQGTQLWSKPMKGTIARGKTPEEDRQKAEELQNDVKNRAENLIIVDLIRNDLSKLAHLNTLTVRDLFQLEQYQTLWQMTSTVSATVDANVSIVSVLQALFPCGSITGAPKIRTMELIQAYEKSPRGLYTGSIGFVLPNFDFCFNVAIRTLLLNPLNHQLTFGVGGGIVMDSDPESEYQECLLKTAFLSRLRAK
jgi:para-aminobenzoate synthetase / 4-amino-4-deoxychorismate lyase